MKFFIFFIFIISVFSLIAEEPPKKTLLDEIYNKKLNELQNTPQFIVDKLDLLYFKKGIHNNDAAALLKKLPSKYKRIIAAYKIIFSIENPRNIPLDDKFLTILLKYQDCKNIQKYIAENFHKAKNSVAEKAFYFLYATGYPFTQEDYENYLKVRSLTDFIKLNFMVQKEEFCSDDLCSENYEDKEKFLNYIKHELYLSSHKNTKNLYNKYKKLLKSLKILKKEIRKLYYKNKKSRGKYENELNAKKEEYDFYLKRTIPTFKLYFYFFGKERKFPKNFNKYDVAENFLINETKPNKKIFYFVYSLFKRKSLPVKIKYYDYIKKSGLKLSKSQNKKLNILKYSKGYLWFKYGYYKKHFPDLFKKLNIKNYLGKNFIYVAVKDFEWFFLEKFRKNKRDVNNLIYFKYYPSYILKEKDELFNLYTKDKLGHFRLSGNESLLYNFLKILLKADVKLTKEQYSLLKPLKVVYIQEILNLFDE